MPRMIKTSEPIFTAVTDSLNQRMPMVAMKAVPMPDHMASLTSIIPKFTHRLPGVVAWSASRYTLCCPCCARFPLLLRCSPGRSPAEQHVQRARDHEEGQRDEARE